MTPEHQRRLDEADPRFDRDLWAKLIEADVTSPEQVQAMVQAGEERYAKWYPKIRDALITLQQPNGSWQELEQDYPHKTPMAIIILGTPNRYIPVYQR